MFRLTETEQTITAEAAHQGPEFPTSEEELAPWLPETSTLQREAATPKSCTVLRDPGTPRGLNPASWKDAFYALPGVWADPPMLPRLWEGGGVGAISILPVLGLAAKANFRSGFWLSLEELAKLAGVDGKTARKGATALENLGLVERKGRWQWGKRVTCWQLSPALAAVQHDATGRMADYFFFPARLILGYNWRHMEGSERAVFLAVALLAKTYDESVSEIYILNYCVKPGVVFDDLRRCQEKKATLRLAVASCTDLMRVSGLSRSTIKTVLRKWKRRPEWNGYPVATPWDPIRVYPSTGGALVYHFRDHVAPVEDSPLELYEQRLNYVPR